MNSQYKKKDNFGRCKLTLSKFLLLDDTCTVHPIYCLSNGSLWTQLMIVRLTVHMQSVPITTWLCKQEEVYLIQFYAIKLASYLQHVSGFLCVLQFPPTIKLTAKIFLESGV